MSSDCELHCTRDRNVGYHESIWTAAIPHIYCKKIVYAALHTHMKTAAQPVYILSQATNRGQNRTVWAGLKAYQNILPKMALPERIYQVWCGWDDVAKCKRPGRLHYILFFCGFFCLYILHFPINSTIFSYFLKYHLNIFTITVFYKWLGSNCLLCGVLFCKNTNPNCFRANCS